MAVTFSTTERALGGTTAPTICTWIVPPAANLVRAVRGQAAVEHTGGRDLDVLRLTGRAEPAHHVDDDVRLGGREHLDLPVGTDRRDHAVRSGDTRFEVHARDQWLAAIRREHREVTGSDRVSGSDVEHRCGRTGRHPRRAGDLDVDRLARPHRCPSRRACRGLGPARR